MKKIIFRCFLSLGALCIMSFVSLTDNSKNPGFYFDEIVLETSSQTVIICDNRGFKCGDIEVVINPK